MTGATSYTIVQRMRVIAKLARGNGIHSNLKKITQEELHHFACDHPRELMGYITCAMIILEGIDPTAHAALHHALNFERSYTSLTERREETESLIGRQLRTVINWENKGAQMLAQLVEAMNLLKLTLAEAALLPASS